METFYDVVAGDQLVLVDFFATWCQPCKMMHPILKQVKDVLGERIRIIKIDVDTHSALSQKYQIQSVPTLCCSVKEMCFGEPAVSCKRLNC